MKEKNSEKEEKKLITSISEFIQATIYYTHDAGVYTVVQGCLYMFQWLSNMQLVGHSNNQASVCLYRDGRSAI